MSTPETIIQPQATIEVVSGVISDRETLIRAAKGIAEHFRSFKDGSESKFVRYFDVVNHKTLHDLFAANVGLALIDEINSTREVVWENADRGLERLVMTYNNNDLTGVFYVPTKPTL